MTAAPLTLPSHGPRRCCSQEYGGSEIRPEATGYGAVLFVENVLRDANDSLQVSQLDDG